jgi:hypothetical protein
VVGVHDVVTELELDVLSYNRDLDVGVVGIGVRVDLSLGFNLGVNIDVDVDLDLRIGIQLILQQACFNCSGNDVLLGLARPTFVAGEAYSRLQIAVHEVDLL